MASYAVSQRIHEVGVRMALGASRADVLMRKTAFTWFFSAKDRQELIAKQLQARLWAYLAAICKNYGMLAFAGAARSPTIQDTIANAASRTQQAIRGFRQTVIRPRQV